MANAGPANKEFVFIWLNLMRERGAHPCIGRDLEEIISSSGLFDEIEAKKVVVPYSQSQDMAQTAESKLGLAWMRNAERVAADLPTRFASQGYTPELVKQHLSELVDIDRGVETDMYFVCAQRRLL
ncbi:hypothetical protein HGRIS_001108 [Hohenbuehelia grisea]|uniref:Uncharacterized protein n=1 Tax=Hohenbuehelia grisea TaxID=104357 RepID=A0ABR3JQG6_9AGAR